MRPCGRRNAAVRMGRRLRRPNGAAADPASYCGASSSSAGAVSGASAGAVPAWLSVPRQPAARGQIDFRAIVAVTLRTARRPWWVAGPRQTGSPGQRPSCLSCSSHPAACSLSAASMPGYRHMLKSDRVALGTGLPEHGRCSSGRLLWQASGRLPGSIPHPSVGTQGRGRLPSLPPLVPASRRLALPAGTEEVNVTRIRWIGIGGRLMGLRRGGPGRGKP